MSEKEKIMLNNTLNPAQIAKRLKAKSAKPMYYSKDGYTFITDGFFVARMKDADYKNLVSGYEITEIEQNDVSMKLFNDLSKQFADIETENTFLHFTYKNGSDTLCFANANGELVVVNKKFLDVVSTDKRSAELPFAYLKRDMPIKLSNDCFVCVIHSNGDMFKELEFVLGGREEITNTANETNKTDETKTNNAKSEPVSNASAPFEVKDGTRQGFYEFYFAERPSAEVLTLLKGFNMHWNRVKTCWFGYVNKDEVSNAILAKVLG